MFDVLPSSRLTMILVYDKGNNLVLYNKRFVLYTRNISESVYPCLNSLYFLISDICFEKLW